MATYIREGCLEIEAQYGPVEDIVQTIEAFTIRSDRLGCVIRRIEPVSSRQSATLKKWECALPHLTGSKVTSWDHLIDLDMPRRNRRTTN